VVQHAFTGSRTELRGSARRLRRGSAFALAVCAIALAGCGSSSSPSATNADRADTRAPSDDPSAIPGVDKVTSSPAATSDIDRFVWNLPFGEPQTLDYLQSFNPAELAVVHNVCDSLVEMKPDYSFGPSLAEKFEHATPDTWVYDVRQGVKFSNGDPLKMSDVVYSIKRHLDPDGGSYYAPLFTDMIKSVKQTGPWQLTVTTKQPNVLINDAMALGLGMVGQEKAITAEGKNYGKPTGKVVCSGPYMVKDWKSGDHLTLARNPNYWGDPPKAAEVEFRFITDAAQGAAALQSGEIDGEFQVPTSVTAQLREATQGKLYFGPNLTYYTLTRANDDANRPVADPRIRQAMSLAIDRQGLTQAIFDGLATPIKWVAVPDSWSYARDTYLAAYDQLPSTDVDLEKAKALVAEAGNPKETLRVAAVADDPASTGVAQAVQDAAKKIGLNLEIKQMPFAQFIQLYFDDAATKGFDWIVSTASYPDFAEPLELPLSTAVPGAQFNRDGYSNPVVTKNADEALGEEDPEKRAELVSEALTQMTSDVKGVPLLTFPERTYMNNRITGAPTGFPVYLSQPWAA
jgi:peptide/nickel transport system substrate-binding protein